MVTPTAISESNTGIAIFMNFRGEINNLKTDNRSLTEKHSVLKKELTEARDSLNHKGMLSL